MAHHDDLEKVDLPISAYAQTAKFRKNFVKQEEYEETDVEEKLGCPSWAPRSSPGFEPMTMTQEEDVFFVYVPSSAPSLLSSKKLLSFTLPNPNQLLKTKPRI